MRSVTIGIATLYQGDCRAVFPNLSGINALVTDPPWGIGVGSGTTSKERGKALYGSDLFDDTEKYVSEVCVPACVQALSLSGGRGLIACGARCLWFYPRPRAIGGFYQPAAVGMSPWGFAGFNPVLFYGKDPRDGKGQSSVMTTLTERPSEDRHPCSKPNGAMLWMVEKATLEGETVLDPFMGSGTTAIACLRLNRRFVGVEIEPRFFDLACERISDFLEGPLFRRVVSP